MRTRPRVFEYAVSVDEDWEVTGDRGGTPLPGDERTEWTPEHLLLAGLCRCVLTSLGHHARRAEVGVRSSGQAHGTVTRREQDGRFAFVAIEVALEVALDPRPDDEALDALLAKAERDCFVGASLTAPPVYRWTVDGIPWS
jgi:organic hydroperoxide reductase OsmC/OhrA